MQIYTGVFAAAAVVIWLCKIHALYHSDDIYSELGVFYSAAVGAIAAIKEVLLVGALCCVFFVATGAVESHPKSRRVIEALFLICAASVVALNVANAEVLGRLGTPITIPLIQYSEILMTGHGRRAVAAWVGSEFIVFSLVCVATAATVFVLVRLLIRRLGKAVVLSLIICATATVALIAQHRRPAPPNMEESGTLAFARSLTTIGADAAATRGHVEPPFTIAQELPALSRPQGEIRHVIVIVLEAAAAQYLDVYGGPFGITPQLSRYSQMSIVVRDAYAQSTSSTIALMTILSSRYPSLARNNEIYRGPSLPQLLSGAGIRTGLFHSSDTSFGRSDQVLRASGFGTIRDYQDRKCGVGLLKDSGNMLGNPDSCTFDDLLTWSSSTADARSFALLWTFQSHYPYFANDEPSIAISPLAVRSRRAGEDMGRYLAALREADRLIGQLINQLQSLGKFDDTLIIVTADHGQAFGHHGTYGNGGSVYDESVRIPLILINPTFKRAGSWGRPSAQIDIAPTVLDAFQLPVPQGWDGVSLFSTTRERPIYLTNTMIDRTVGYRVADRKVIVNFLRGTVETYDLKSDPNELHDLAPGQTAEEIEQQRRWVARWAEQSNHAGSEKRKNR